MRTTLFVLAALSWLGSPAVAAAESWILWESVEERRPRPVDSVFPSQAACASRGQERIAQLKQEFKPPRAGVVLETIDGGLTARARWQVTSDSKARVAGLTEHRKTLESILTIYETDRRSPATPAAKDQGYLDQIQERIKSKWIYPYESSKRGVGGELSIEFGIAKSGELQFIKQRRSSGIELLDDYAMRAVQLASPFPPVPDAISKGDLPIHGIFRYQLLGSGLINTYLRLSSPLLQPGVEQRARAVAGMVTVEVTDFSHAWYPRAAAQKVEDSWRTPDTSSTPLQKPRISVVINNDGTLKAAPQIERSSGDPLYDQAAVRAIVESSPFAPLPTPASSGALSALFNFDLGQLVVVQKPIDDSRRLNAETDQKLIESTRRQIAETDRKIAEAKAARPTTKWLDATVLRYQC